VLGTSMATGEAAAQLAARYLAKTAMKSSSNTELALVI
jgi:hypothetical protein